jgi:hypothetical protein
MLQFNVVLFSHGTEFLRLLGAAVPALRRERSRPTARARPFLAATACAPPTAPVRRQRAEIRRGSPAVDSLLDAHRGVRATGRKRGSPAPVSVFELDGRHDPRRESSD